MQVTLANPRGFCAGVDRAIDIVNRALEVFGAPVYVRHEVVHNKTVVDDLRDRGAIFVDELDEVPDDTIVIFSAHGVSRAVREEAARRQLKVFDATCPLVTKVHIEVIKFSKEGRECILIGHAGHPEVEGTMGQFDTSNGGTIKLVEDEEDARAVQIDDPRTASFVTQTTLSMDDTARIIDILRERFPEIQGPRKDDICYATQNRQDSVKEVIKQSEILIVIGSKNSSNSNRLKEIADNQGKPAYLIDSSSDIEGQWLNDVDSVGITAGASAPEILVQEVVSYLMSNGGHEIIEVEGAQESVNFPVPSSLK
ncbi:MAG: 4-hydroxy-3-methylbut-2-enyl diphosphate reductase, partial [Litorivicinaceae bacterium]